MNDLHATAAAYLRLGIETASLSIAVCLRWAERILAAGDEAPGDIVEVVWSPTPERMILALEDVAGDRDVELAARWLLRTLHAQLMDGRDASDVVRAAMHAIHRGRLGDGAHWTFTTMADVVDDAELDYHGTLKEATAELLGLLDKHAAPDLPPALL